MFYTFLKQKIASIGVALLIVAAGAFFWLESGSFNREELAVEVSFSSSSTPLGSLGQEIDVLPAPVSWPSLLIESKDDTPEDLQAALNKAMAKAGLPPALRWCDFSSEDRTTGKAVLSEIAWMGSTQNPNDEWIELAHIGGQNAGTKGWQLMNRSGKIKIELGAATSSSRGDFLILGRASGDYFGALSNSGDWLKVFDGDCKVIDELDASNGWPAGDNVAKKTLERAADGSSWHTSADVGGSPGAKNSEAPLIISASTPTSATTSPQSSVPLNQPTTTSIIISATTSTNATSSTQAPNIIPATPTSTTSYPLSHVVIHSLQITGGEGATDEDYIKIFNPSVGSADVSGWKLRKRTQSGTESSIKVFPDGSVIAPGGYFTWANSMNGFGSNIGANVSSTQILSNDNSAALFDLAGTLVDAVAWGSGHVTPYIEGGAYPQNPAMSQKISRKLEAGNIRDAGNNAEDFELN